MGIAIIEYTLLDKNIDEEITFHSEYIYDTHIESYGSNWNIEEQYEWVNLKDGTTCYIGEHGAKFSYDGAIYSVGFFDPDKKDHELVKQVLIDLGLL